MTNENPKYYHWNKSKKRGVVTKTLKNHSEYFGNFATEEEAKTAVKLHKKYGWNIENRWKVRAEVKEIFEKVKQNGSS